MKTMKRTARKDSMSEHVHTIPDGGSTQGSLIKPSQSSSYPMHTHLYQCDGQTFETSRSMNEPGHTHDTIKGKTSGPKAMPTKESFGPRNDSLVRIGGDWCVRNGEGVTIHKGRTPEDACRHYDSMDSYDEAFAKKAAGVTDDETWEKAKAHSMTNFGEHKWPYVQHVHTILGGK